MHDVPSVFLPLSHEHTIPMAAVHETTAHRLSQIRSSMKKKNLSAYIVHHLPTIRYLTNFSGSNATLIITARNVYFFTDDRYTEQIAGELFAIDGLRTFIERNVWKAVAEKKLIRSGQIVGFESNVVSVDAAAAIRKAVKGISLKAAPGLARETTIAKSAEELRYLRQAAHIAAQVYEFVLGFVKPGMREIDIAAEISYQGRKRGSEGDAFGIILVGGEHGAFVHGRAGERKLKKGDVVTLDFGCIVNGFNSDMTRTFSIGKAPQEAKNAWRAVTEAHKRSIDAVRAGVKAASLDAIARRIITDAGYGDYFKHSLGHGLGIEVHEQPGISFANKDGVVPENAVITIEPGVYIPGKFGMRLEDDVHVTAHDPVLLTTSPREMIEL